MKKVSVGHSPESSLLVLNMHVPAQEAILQVCVCVCWGCGGAGWEKSSSNTAPILQVGKLRLGEMLSLGSPTHK